MRASFLSTTDVLSEWRNDTDCVPAIIDAPALEGAWDGPGHLFEQQAREVCIGCPVRIKCLSDAMADPAAEGMRGGFFFEAGTVTVATNKEIVKEFGIKAPQRNRPRKAFVRESLVERA